MDKNQMWIDCRICVMQQTDNFFMFDKTLSV